MIIRICRSDSAETNIKPMRNLSSEEWADIISFAPEARARAIERFKGSEGAYLNYKNIVMDFAETFGMDDGTYVNAQTKELAQAENYKDVIVPHCLANDCLGYLYNLDDIPDETSAMKMNEYQNVLNLPDTNQKEVRPFCNLSM